ncbi:MAG TPA: hypothetical protein VJN39_07535 [Gemmatimonadales bacterium]|nr:hypothetical protein [Gemmatimonadales bacterium]
MASLGSGQGTPARLTQFLEQTIELNRDDMGAAATGKPVVKVLATSDQREVAVFGIVSVNVPRSFYVRSVSDFSKSLRTPSRPRPRFGIFSDPVAVADVAALSVPHDDVQDLARCRPGACKVKLSAAAIARLQGSLDPNSPSADSVASAYFRARMMDYITGYRARGNTALIVYDDQRAAAAAADVFNGILSRSPYMYQYAPSLERYLKDYPADRPADVSEVLFWSEDDFPSLKPTITITHEIVYAPPELPGSTLIVAKQLYADHYFDGALDLTAVVDQASDSAHTPGIFLVLLHRLHFDDLPSGGLMNVRGKVIGKVRDETMTFLRDVKRRSEQAYASAPGN